MSKPITVDTLTIVIRTDKGEVYLNIADSKLYSPSIITGKGSRRRTKSLKLKQFDLCGYPYAEIDLTS